MKFLRHENINTISEVWLKDKDLMFITDSYFGGSIRQYFNFTKVLIQNRNPEVESNKVMVQNGAIGS